jgi:hypothetical protein
VLSFSNSCVFFPYTLNFVNIKEIEVFFFSSSCVVLCFALCVLGCYCFVLLQVFVLCFSFSFSYSLLPPPLFY